MRAGAILIVVYWAIFTVKRHFTPRLTAAIKANTYDLTGMTRKQSGPHSASVGRLRRQNGPCV